jgi:dCTP deaminase
MVLSRPDILKRVQKGDLRFTPSVSPSAIKQCSIDLRLGRTFTVFKKEEKGYIATLRMQKAKQIFEEGDLWDQQEHDFYTLRSGELVLAQTLEVVHLPKDLMGLVEGRSSWARLGVGVHVTAPKIDPGFNQPITLELTNHSKVHLELQAGADQPCQLILLYLSKALKPEEMYGSLPGDSFADRATPVLTKKTKKK